MKIGKLDSLLWAGVAIGVLYFVSKFQRKFEEGLVFVGEAYGRARTGTTNLIETFFPLVDPDSLMTYAVTFPDGKRHAVPGESVSRGGIFVYNGIRYRLMTNKDGFKFAFPA